MLTVDNQVIDESLQLWTKSEWDEKSVHFPSIDISLNIRSMLVTMMFLKGCRALQQCTTTRHCHSCLDHV